MLVRVTPLQELEDPQPGKDKHESGVKLVVSLPRTYVVCHTHEPFSHQRKTCTWRGPKAYSWYRTCFEYAVENVITL